MGGKVLERISSAKILKVIVSSDLSWGHHIQYICPKASQPVYFLCMLRRPDASSTDMLNFYKSTIRASVEYACPVWHTGLTVEQTDSVETIQKRAMKIISPDMTYAEALGAAGLERLDARRERLARPFFLQILSPHHKFNYLIPQPRIIEYGLRRRTYSPFQQCVLLGQRERSLTMDLTCDVCHRLLLICPCGL